MSEPTAPTEYVVCLDNAGYPASLERRKIYRTLPDEQATQHGYIRVIDESGEDYLYPHHCFTPIHLPEEAVRAFSTAG